VITLSTDIGLGHRKRGWKVDPYSFPTVYHMTYFSLNILTKETPRFWFQFWTDFNRLYYYYKSALNYPIPRLFLFISPSKLDHE